RFRLRVIEDDIQLAYVLYDPPSVLSFLHGVGQHFESNRSVSPICHPNLLATTYQEPLTCCPRQAPLRLACLLHLIGRYSGASGHSHLLASSSSTVDFFVEHQVVCVGKLELVNVRAPEIHAFSRVSVGMPKDCLNIFRRVCITC